MISTMRVLIFSALTLLKLASTQECDADCNACADVADIGKITCDKGTCTIEANGDLDLDYLVTEDLRTITADVCREKCQEQSNNHDAKSCKFFRWYDIESTKTTKTMCSLQTTCPKSATCDPIYKHCVSGQLGCSDDCKKLQPCALTKATWNHDNFHVVCLDTDGNDINIYLDDIKDKEITNGTVCKTVRKCSEWTEEDEHPESSYHRKLAVFCDGTNIQGEKGTWTVELHTGSQEASEKMINDNAGTITEQECGATCSPIKLTSYTSQWWADIICENPLVDNNLSEPNSCILLCDNHLEKTIDCEYDVHGDKAWRDADGNVLEEEDIAC